MPGRRRRGSNLRQRDPCRSQGGFAIHCATAAPSLTYQFRRDAMTQWVNYGKWASAAQWTANLQGPFCHRFKPRRWRPGLTEGLNALDHLVADWL
ncbi:hypothetical protein PoB_001626500 [Plakobranchus ocellatus]|uniref:Uncharacterized protein n=1 Tax=Plakobranchus ocellatus TaxID=259542 RepID=A0AAV3Z3M6_9GAST|nr:hypothetical protein PoB_001626500 [Plakobranchus ocellatus]